MTLQKDINDALLCAPSSAHGRIILVRQAEDNSIKVVLDCSSAALPAVIRGLCRQAAKKDVAVWELCKSNYGILSLHEWVDADNDSTLPSRVQQPKRRRPK